MLAPGGVYFLVGPTGSGKTSVAHRLALQTRARILSVDSMAVYQGMCIGTATPSEELRSEVPYHGIAVVAPQDSYSVHQYLEVAGAAWREASSQGVPLIVAGGSGLYVKCITEGLSDTPSADASLREAWAERLRTDGLEALQEEVQRLHGEAYASMTSSDRRNPRRLIRLLERGSAEASHWAGGPSLVGLSLAPDDLKLRLLKRATMMMEAGLLEETRKLLESGLHQTASQAIGYAEAIDVLGGNCTEQDAIGSIAHRSWRLAKKQMTWFRHQANVSWIEVGPTFNEAELASQVLERWLDIGPSELRI